jgi:hypothetical protein
VRSSKTEDDEVHNPDVDAAVKGGGYRSKGPKWRKKYLRVLPFEEARKCAQKMSFASRCGVALEPNSHRARLLSSPAFAALATWTLLRLTEACPKAWVLANTQGAMGRVGRRGEEVAISRALHAERA